MTRDEKMLALIDRGGRGLEIGPSYSPLAPKAQGWNVETVDHLDADALRGKYSAWGVDVSKVEEVDHVVAEGSTLAETVGRPAAFDFIIASHVIEHTPDLVTFLADCESLLKPGGILSLAIPDKRFCFDVLQSVSTTGDVFQAYLEKRTRLTAGNILDCYLNHAMRGDQIAWFDAGRDGLRLVHDVPLAWQLTESYIREGKYRDAHAWYFTPASFRLILQDLVDVGLVRLGIAAFHDTHGFEFFASLKSGHAAARDNRLKWLTAVADGH